MVGVVTALGLSLALTLTMVWIGPRIGFVDVPDDPELKAHDLPAVPLGGVAIFTAVHAGLAVAELFDVRLFVASGLLFVLGLADDRLGLSPILRLAVTAVAGIVLAVGYEGALSRVLLVVFVVVAVNAVNLYDGLDGLAGSAAAIAALAVAGVAQLRGLTGWGGVILAAALIGFLVLNWHPAKAFLGDNGAYLIDIVRHNALFRQYMPGLGQQLHQRITGLVVRIGARIGYRQDGNVQRLEFACVGIV